MLRSARMRIARLLLYLGGAFLLVLIASAAEAPGSRHRHLTGDNDHAGGIAAASTYLVLNVAAGRICLRTADSIMLNAPCSAGSGVVLRDPATGRVWEFTTPIGVFSVKAKAENPLWQRPDWAYLEEGLPVPDDPAQRVVEDELGGFSIDLGDGLYIHGTLYTRLLGMNVTHGCIRVADKDLAEIYHGVEVGTPVYIF